QRERDQRRCGGARDRERGEGTRIGCRTARPLRRQCGRRGRSARHGHWSCSRRAQAARACRRVCGRARSRGAERSVRVAEPCRHQRAGPRRGESQRQRRRNRDRPSARDDGSAPRGLAPARAAPAPGPLRACDSLCRCGSGPGCPVPSGVPYAAAPSVDWVNVPVLGELVFHALQAVGGDRGLLLAQLVAVSLTLTLLALGMRALGAPDAASAAVLVLVFFAAFPSFIIVRAQLFSLVLFCVALLLLRAESREPTRRVWLLVPLIVLWANLHGAVLVGLAVVASYLVLERARREPVVAASVLAACCAALFLTPALAASGKYYLGVLRSEAAQRGEG